MCYDNVRRAAFFDGANTEKSTLVTYETNLNGLLGASADDRPS